MYLTKAFSPSILECNSLLIAISLLTVDIISQNPPFFNILRLSFTFLPILIFKSKKISRLNRLIHCEMIFTFVFFKLTCINNYKWFDENALWSESHTSYELCSLSKIIIYKILLKFNGNMEYFAIL